MVEEEVEGRDSVCMRDLIVSAGKKRKLYDIPADAPATACCHSGSGCNSRLVVGKFFCGVRVGAREEAFHFRNNNETVSLLPNQAAHPPVSRISVPSCPCQNPLIPWCRHTSLITANGFGAICTTPEDGAGTWILHFTSSTGVSTRLVNAPEMAPVSHSAESGSGCWRE